MKKVSFVIPCYRSANTIGVVVDEIRDTMPTLPEYDYEIIQKYKEESEYSMTFVDFDAVEFL